MKEIDFSKFTNKTVSEIKGFVASNSENYIEIVVCFTDGEKLTIGISDQQPCLYVYNK